MLFSMVSTEIKDCNAFNPILIQPNIVIDAVGNPSSLGKFKTNKLSWFDKVFIIEIKRKINIVCKNTYSVPQNQLNWKKEVHVIYLNADSIKIVVFSLH